MTGFVTKPLCLSQRTHKRLRLGLILEAAVIVWLVMPLAVQAQRAHNMRLVGTNDLQARSAYQPIVQRQVVDGVDKYIAYIGHHYGRAKNPLNNAMETNGVSIVDVTDPKRPIYLHHIPGVAGAQMVRACSGDELPHGVSRKTYLLRSNGNRAHEIYDVSNPSNPSLLTTVVANLNGTHKNYWECSTGIAYLVSGVPGWHTNRMIQVFNLSNPTNPVFIRNFGLDGHQPGAKVPPPQSLHGCISVIERNRIYCGHGINANGILVILDRNELINPTVPLVDPASPTVAELQAPLITRFDTPISMGAHTTFPVLGYKLPRLGPANADRDFVVLVNESIANECNENRQMAFMVDITDEAYPQIVSNIDVSEAEGDYCTVGGRFGSHASNENFTDVFYRKLVFISWFNAGARGIDIRDPFNPKEVAYFVPRITKNTDDRNGKFVIQTNNVEVDDRGLVYTTDRANTGLHILELTGGAKKIADLP